MARINSAAQLEKVRKDIVLKKDPNKPCIAICGGIGCLGGREDLIRAFEKEIKKQKLEGKVDVRVTGCHGFCAQGPNIVIYPEEICYTKVKPEDAQQIISETVVGKTIVDRLVYIDPNTGEKAVHQSEIPFYKKQVRNILGMNPKIDPKSIDDYLAIGGYSSLAKALLEMKPQEVLEEVKKANLRGRGGGGFPAGLKWETARNAPAELKYVICNGHEGEPGAYMDRAIFQGNPHLIIEGLIIGGYAIGAKQGFIYTRHDMPRLRENIDIALEAAREHGFIGNDILGSGFDFDIEVHLDVGIFVSGEASALMRSIEGKAPEPRPKYTRTAVKGIWERPSNLNNVETWANVPQIIGKGADWYLGIGSEGSKGTKMISLSGNIVNSGVVEVPFGTSLKEIVYDIGGGIPNGKKLKAIHFGAAMGGSLPAELIDTPLDFDVMSKLGAAIGAGGLFVMDEDTSMVEMNRFFLEFLADESCGKCVPCREGIRQMLRILTRMSMGKGKEGDIEALEELCEVGSLASLCALGKTTSSPIYSSLRYFRNEYEASIEDKGCV
ncbi:MAG TPA: NADH-ubiquinone oxidoreductase-F iron-sulfur binding region domain-containing protein [Syntrophorhabdus sp.]|nr:NADH-ubiquinone oxidoreductase-F iron-sulfur binding region domain-containing protein [Pseudomonadota bacterium]HNQ45982.1 NADH-ubiquinone oxidoreductase-F iron-sulfur binding region domain-containing protein [Syntrophorhabdus sp.]HNS77552.1 NADH-ubiquinone oxidoreductase-F iron-sulfur binding region domain-containing protein [Syntrophorhabdus sp.]HNY69913.1 NADH-ubiquinone oxidoreductase-F iron-sulfur binding region domain-containing protein [Syntrophorhabdus sp.]HOH26104.1 NADH-ubiquinone 